MKDSVQGQVSTEIEDGDQRDGKSIRRVAILRLCKFRHTQISLYTMLFIILMTQIPSRSQLKP